MIPTSYTVRSVAGQPGQDHPKSWVIEVSNDGTEHSWTEMDRHNNNEDLNGSRVTVNFKTSLVRSQWIRFFRFRQTGENHGGGNELILSSLEIFGKLLEE